MQLPKILKLFFFQACLEQNKTGSIVAKHDTLPPVYGVEMGMPAAERIRIG
jgi:hypothetical protein